MATPDRPRFFCTRPGGTLTPLVAVDELPANITIRGVPRTLNAGETQGMTSCGLAPQRPEPWSVDGVTQSSERETGKEPLHDMHSLLMQIMTNTNVSEPMRASAQVLLFQGIERHGVAGEGTPANELSPIAPTFYTKNPQMGNKHASGSKKEYCSYWIRHGECDYAQQGCLFKHEMPVDMAMIEKLGLRDIPRWYREKYNVPSLLQTSQGRPQLAITDQVPMRALPSPAPPTEESYASKVSTVNANPNANKSPPQFDKSPPRGPASRGGHNGFANYNQHRAGGRNGASNGHPANNWKGTHRGGRNRNMGYVRPSISLERDGGRSGECSPGAFDYGAHGFGGNQVRTPTTPVAVPATVPITVSATGRAGAPMAAHRSLLDDGNSRNQNAYWPLNELTEYNEDMFEDAPNKPAELRSRHPLHLYQQSSTTFSDGGVIIPTVGYDSNFGVFTQAEVSPRKQSASNGSHGTIKADYESLTPQIGDLHVADNVPLNLADTRVTWGPIGGPILKRTSPPTENITQLFGPYSNAPRGN
ncbi:Zinc finger CCCH-type [Penicillium cf. griseofulvum]|nr:Zinc finger CCCH-type [Penicillium cf. griseofulvum]